MFRTIWGFIKHEPSFTIGMSVTIVLTLETGLVDKTFTLWQDYAPLIVGIMVRFFVSPKKFFQDVDHSIVQSTGRGSINPIPPTEPPDAA